MSCPPAAAELVQVVWALFVLYKPRARCDARVFSMTSRTSATSPAVVVLIVVKPTAFLMGRRQCVPDGACTRVLKYQ